MNTKLFKKLNEKVELNSIKNQPMTEEEKRNIETKIIFEGCIKELAKDMDFKPEE